MIHSGLNLGLKYKSSQTTVNKAQVDNEFQLNWKMVITFIQ